MKNIFFLFIASLLLSVSAQAQKKAKSAPKVSVPESVTESFKGTYANVENNKWDRTYTGNYVAHFTTADNLSQEVEYNNSGTVIKSKTTYNLSALPETVSTAVEGKYAGATISEAVKMEIPGVDAYYKVKIETTDKIKKDLFISEEGTVAE